MWWCQSFSSIVLMRYAEKHIPAHQVPHNRVHPFPGSKNLPLQEFESSVAVTSTEKRLKVDWQRNVWRGRENSFTKTYWFGNLRAGLLTAGRHLNSIFSSLKYPNRKLIPSGNTKWQPSVPECQTQEPLFIHLMSINNVITFFRPLELPNKICLHRLLRWTLLDFYLDLPGFLRNILCEDFCLEFGQPKSEILGAFLGLFSLPS